MGPSIPEIDRSARGPPTLHPAAHCDPDRVSGALARRRSPIGKPPRRRRRPLRCGGSAGAHELIAPPSSPLPFRRFERAFRALRVAARLARVRDQAPVLGAQGVVRARPGVGARGGALGLSVVALLQAHARELLPQARIARLDPERALERSRGVREAPGRGVGARAVQEPRDREVLGARRGLGQGSGFGKRPGRRIRSGRLYHGCAAGEGDCQECEEGPHRTPILICFYLPNRRSIQLFACCFTPSTAMPRADAQGARSAGAEPRAKGSSTAPEQAKSARNPLSGSISTFSIPSGWRSASGSGARAAIISPHTGSAAPAPVSRAARSEE